MVLCMRVGAGSSRSDVPQPGPACAHVDKSGEPGARCAVQVRLRGGALPTLHLPPARPTCVLEPEEAAPVSGLRLRGHTGLAPPRALLLPSL